MKKILSVCAFVGVASAENIGGLSKDVLTVDAFESINDFYSSARDTFLARQGLADFVALYERKTIVDASY